MLTGVLFALLLLMLAVMAGCEGPPGESITGPPGPQGIQGPVGPQGEPGDPAVASVVTRTYSREDASLGDQVAIVRLAVPEVTEAVYVNGAVQVYYELADNWMALPFTVGSDYTQNLEVDEVVQFTYSYGAGEVNLLFNTSYTTILRSQVLDGTVRIVIFGGAGKNAPDTGAFRLP
jgi:hypothetical protein